MDLHGAVSATFEIAHDAELAAQGLVKAGFAAGDVELVPLDEAGGYTVCVAADERFREAERILAGYEPVLRRTVLDDDTPSFRPDPDWPVPEADFEEQQTAAFLTPPDED